MGLITVSQDLMFGLIAFLTAGMLINVIIVVILALSFRRLCKRLEEEVFTNIEKVGVASGIKRNKYTSSERRKSEDEDLEWYESVQATETQTEQQNGQQSHVGSLQAAGGNTTMVPNWVPKTQGNLSIEMKGTVSSDNGAIEDSTYDNEELDLSGFEEFYTEPVEKVDGLTENLVSKTKPKLQPKPRNTQQRKIKGKLPAHFTDCHGDSKKTASLGRNDANIEATKAHRRSHDPRLQQTNIQPTITREQRQQRERRPKRKEIQFLSGGHALVDQTQGEEQYVAMENEAYEQEIYSNQEVVDDFKGTGYQIDEQESYENDDIIAQHRATMTTHEEIVEESFYMNYSG